MMIITGLLYSIYFVILGLAARTSYHLISRSRLIIERKTDFMTHALFSGIFLHVLMFNVFQLVGINNQTALILTFVAVLISLAIIITHAIKFGAHAASIKPTKTNSVIITLVILGSLGIYWNGSQLPNIAWDSWMVWTGKANQWVNHGLSVPMNKMDGWLSSPNSIFNVSAHYPDGLPLIYFLPKLFNVTDSDTTYVLYLVTFAMMTLLLASRLQRKGASSYLQFFMVLVLYTTPLLNNHLMIGGYADIWMAMYIVLIMLTFIDYHEKRDLGVGITLICYLTMLPMLKLEGWVWLFLFIITHLIVIAANHPDRLKIAGFFLAVLLMVIALGGIKLTLPMGNITINTENIEIFHLIDANIQFVDITDEVLAGFIGQNNWSILWFGLPFLLISFFVNKHDHASQIAHVFFILALFCFFFLFYFTEASNWAKDLTALNRVVLQLVPCYIFLLFKMLNRLSGVQQK
jgi:hypothetical protein